MTTSSSQKESHCTCSRLGRKICGNSLCKRSFAVHQRAKYWDYQRNVDEPHDIYIASTQECHFDCGHGHRFALPLQKVIRDRRWCNRCINKTEVKLQDWLEEQLPNKIKVQTQVRFEWCRNPHSGRHLPFDMAIPAWKLILELDGRQHYHFQKGWPSPVPMQLRDAFKMQMAIKRGWTVIRLVQEHVWFDKENWEQRLKKHLRKRHHHPRTILLDSDGTCEFNGLREILLRHNIPGTNE
jgi:very-short-patch-repair endonuclease